MSDILEEAFHSLAVSSYLPGPFDPYPHQSAVADALLSGRRVFLRAPAGSGKTLAGWLPWLTGRLQQCDLPPKLLHIVPGGTFYESLYRRLTAITAVAEGTRVGIQTEGDAFDPFFLGDAILTTVDQLLSVALHRPLGLHPGLSNINAGTILGSFALFDEFPALASRDTLVAWLGLLRRYYPVTPCLWTTSVLPKPLCERIAEALDAEYIDASDFTAGGRREWSVAENRALTPEAILRLHRRRTIVVCNTVRGAQTLYRALRRVVQQDGSSLELLLLHQHLFSRDRRAVEDRAETLFRPGSSEQALLVTTSGIETGTDISAELLVSDLTTPDTLLRRASRCARFVGEKGRVVVARITDFTPGITYPAPPWESLLAQLGDSEPKTFAEELAILDAIWAQAPAELQPEALRRLPANMEIDAAPVQIITGEKELPARLFPRVGAALHRVPETVQDPFELERFSMAISSLERGWRQWQASGCPGEWFALTPRWSSGDQQTPSWALVENPAEFHAGARLIVLNSEAVSYDQTLGLELSPGTAYQSERLPAQHTSWHPFDQHLLSFQEHAVSTLAAYEGLYPRYRCILRYLGKHWHIPVVELEQWMRLSILWHDAGKLTADWQRAAHRWQAEGRRRPAGEGTLGRIDFVYRRDGEFPCPEHAALSGLVLTRSMQALLGPREALYRGTIAALCHHHGQFPSRDGLDLTPHPEAWGTLLELATKAIGDERLLRRIDRVGWTMTMRGLTPIPSTPPVDPDAWMAYSLLVRAIRLADREVALEELFAG
ncbi:MAG TPA: CRISPR-associated endonuclease Cas3'' [Armatimonadota bacterium]